MKIRMFISSIFILLASGNLLAQDDDYDYHPALSDNFLVTVGAFISDKSFEISADGGIAGDIGDRIDFGNALSVDASTTQFNAQLRWKFGKQRKWSLWGQYFKTDSSGESVLDEDIHWQDIFFGEGTFVGAGVDMEIARVFIGRNIIKNEQHDLGIGIGVHILDIGAYIEGEVIFEDGSSEFRRGDAKTSQPLPNVGFWYNYSPARNWLLHARVDWISANIGDYDGTLWNTSIGVNYQAFRNVGFDLAYQFFDLNFGIDKSNWVGGIDMKYQGPVISATFNW